MDDEEIPFAADPRDWYLMYTTLRDLKADLFGKLGAFIIDLNILRADLAQAKGDPWGTGDNPIGWKILNDTLAQALQPIIFPYADYPDIFIDALLNETGQNPLQLALKSGPGLNIIIPYFDFVLPDKKNFLYLLLKKGVPTYTPVDDFLHRMLEDFDIDGDDYYDVPHVSLTLLQELGGLSVKAKGDVELDGTSITMEFEYQDNQKDPGDLEDELDDWEVTFTFSEYGFQSYVSYSDDGEEFYRKESLQTIPGFEVSVLLGVSAVSIIGVIYVVMKKRKK
jgi:hypothetical protein